MRQFRMFYRQDVPQLGGEIHQPYHLSYALGSPWQIKGIRRDIPYLRHGRMPEIDLAGHVQLHSRLRMAKSKSSVHSSFAHVLSTMCPSWRIPTVSSTLTDGVLRGSQEAVTRCLPSCSKRYRRSNETASRA
jgi:hypothetical protein